LSVVAVIVCVPSNSVTGLNVALPLPLSAPEPTVVPSTANVTLPVVRGTPPTST
jgi:hypothetical protein